MSKTLFAWGSSTIEYMDASLASLAASVSRGVFNGGDAGARADATLAQQGTIPASIDFGGAVLTQGQSVAVAVSNIQPSLMIKQWAGTVEGTAISGILNYTDNGWMFRRTDAGEAATVPAATRFLPTLPDDAGAIQIINVGKNDVLSGTSAAEIFDKTGLMHADVADNAGTIVVLGHFVVRDSNAPQQARVLELNRLLVEKYGDAYVDVQSYLMSARIWTDMALAPTEDDLARQARGVLPASLALDGLHLSDAANVAVTANLLRPHLLERGVAADPSHFWGTSAAETLVANASNDQLLGFAGNDVLVGGAGADRLDGGAGIDSASYQNSAAGVRADMISPNTNAGDAAGDRYISIENLVGSSHDDTLYADNLANAIFGGDGNDALSGRGGDDTLSGGNGNDMFYGGLGADLIDGGAGIDMVSFEFSSSGAVEVDLANPSVNTAEATGDIYANVENLRGSYLGDRLTGTDGANRIEGYNGDDFIYGGKSEKDLRDVISGDDGNDWIELGYGNDEGYGGNGNDTVDGGFGADVIIGNEGDDQLSGSALGDMLFGGGGSDFLNGGFGFDRLNGGEGADRFFHLGNRNHGADWVQDYNAAQNDVLEFGRTGTAADFKVNFARTGNAGSDEVDEAFVIHIPSGQIVWALVDGAAQDHLWLTVQGVQQDLLI